MDPGPAQRFWEQYGYADMLVPDEQLYDLVFDPHEANNLALSPGHADVLAEMRARLRDWMNATRDPLNEGTIPPPPVEVPRTDSVKFSNNE